MFITPTFRDNTPNTGQIISALYGDGTGNTDRTAYSQLWTGVICNPASMNLVYLTGGYNKIPDSLIANTIYILSEGDYIEQTYTNMNTCSALIGIGNVKISTNRYQDYTVRMAYKNEIVDNLKLDGSHSGSNLKETTIHGRNAYGVVIDGTNTTNNTINQVQSYNHSY
jgi:hypothetical protein